MKNVTTGKMDVFELPVTECIEIRQVAIKHWDYEPALQTLMTNQATEIERVKFEKKKAEADKVAQDAKHARELAAKHAEAEQSSIELGKQEEIAASERRVEALDKEAKLNATAAAHKEEQAHKQALMSILENMSPGATNYPVNRSLNKNKFILRLFFILKIDILNFPIF